MGKCNLDHSNQEVFHKLQSQQEYLPTTLYERISEYLQSNPGQEELNTLFHLLKKYDLVSSEEQEIRNRGMIELISIRN